MNRKKYRKILEAILFSANKPLSTEEIAKQSDMPKGFVEENLSELKDEYQDRGMKLSKEVQGWEMKVENDLLPEIRKVIKPEFDRAVLKTLATIAVNEPVKQSKIVKIRGNKSYRHIDELEEKGFIKTVPFKRTRKVMLTEKFSSYFKMEKNKIKEKLEKTDGVGKIKE